MLQGDMPDIVNMHVILTYVAGHSQHVAPAHIGQNTGAPSYAPP